MQIDIGLNAGEFRFEGIKLGFYGGVFELLGKIRIKAGRMIFFREAFGAGRNGDGIKIAGVGAKVEFVIPNGAAIYAGVNIPGNTVRVIQIDTAEAIPLEEGRKDGAWLDERRTVKAATFAVIEIQEKRKPFAGRYARDGFAPGGEVLSGAQIKAFGEIESDIMRHGGHSFRGQKEPLT